MKHVSIPTHSFSTIPISSPEQRKQRAEAEALAVQQKLFDQAKWRSDIEKCPKPRFYERPAYNTPQYWRDSARGWITGDEQQADLADFEARRRRAVDSKHDRAAPPHRHDRAAPHPSKQFAKAMATQAARDDRLTPQSKALLQVLVARTGRGRSTDTTKTTLGVIMNRCPRSIQRYVQELVKFGYIRTQTIKSRRTGFFIGLRIWIMDCVLPFWKQGGVEYDADKWCQLPGSRRKRVETDVSPTKVNNLLISALSAKKPSWLGEFAYGLASP
ncbi:hypothetical protein [Aeoliella sp.]|uniref:hypothetical protein n=1 Tax=Aeoliella sp. TaxID=2795800 RepID=UPI003CCBDBBC